MPKGQSFSGAGKVVLLWRDRAKRVLVAGTLGLYGLRPVNRLCDLCPDASGICVRVPDDVMSKAGVRVRVSGAEELAQASKAR